jgi:hypothetical protein
MVVFTKSLNETKIQKHRINFISKNTTFQFGEYAFAPAIESKMELVHLTNLKKIIKKVVKRKRIKKNRKNRNQTMGKGKGSGNKQKLKTYKI